MTVQDSSDDELLAAWRDAVVAAELAERLSTEAINAAEQADVRAASARELADLAGMVARSTARVADQAAVAATRADELANKLGRDEASTRDFQGALSS